VKKWWKELMLKNPDIVLIAGDIIDDRYAIVNKTSKFGAFAKLKTNKDRWLF
jgi:predicted MPP superfamily phosphohydrolase